MNLARLCRDRFSFTRGCAALGLLSAASACGDAPRSSPAPTGDCGVDSTRPSCASPAPSPWFLYVGDDRFNLELNAEEGTLTGTAELFGMREDALGRMENVRISGDAVREGELGAAGFWWSPDGRFVVFTVYQEHPWFDPYAPMHTHWVAMGSEGPGEPAPLPDLPLQPALERLHFSADSSKLLAVGEQGLYLTHFGDGPAPATKVKGLEHVYDAWFCKDPRFALVETWDDLTFVVDLDGKGQAKTVPLDAKLSRDQRWLFFQNHDGTHLIACSTDSALTYLELEEAVTGSVKWSMDSRYLTYREKGGALTIARAREGTQRPLWQSETARAGTWVSNTTSYIYGVPSGDSETWHIVDFTDDQVQERKSTLTFTADSLVSRGERLFFFRKDPASESDPPRGELWMAELSTLAQPRLIAKDVSWSTGHYEPAQNLFVHPGRAEYGAELYAHDLGPDMHKPRPLLGEGFLGDLSVVSRMPSGRGLIVGHSVMRARAYDELWVVPYDETGGVPARINDGTGFYTSDYDGCPDCGPKFQPSP